MTVVYSAVLIGLELITRVLTMFVQIRVEELWNSAESDGWRPSSAPRSEWPRMMLF